MTAITSYLYKQNHTVITVDPTVGTTMSMFYTPNIKVYRGIDNEIRVNFKNKDQQKTSIVDKTVTFIMIDKEASTTLITRTITPVNAPDGVGKFTLTETDLLNLDEKFYTYSFKVVDGEGNTQIGYSDDTYGAGGVLELVEGVYPTFKASTSEAFGAGNTGSVIYNDPYINRNVAQHTAQVYFSSAFTGTLLIEGSLGPATQSLNNDDFTTIQTETYTAQTDNAVANWNGVYSAIRFTRSGTELSKVLYRP